MGDWIRLNPDDLAKPLPRTIRGVQVNLFPSPHNVPEMARGHYDDDKRCFVIEFQYLGERSEPLQIGGEEGNIRLKIGKYSKRLYRIEIDVAAVKAGEVELCVDAPQLVDAAVKKLHDRAAREGDREKYDLASEVLSTRRNELFEALGA